MVINEIDSGATTGCEAEAWAMADAGDGSSSSLDAAKRSEAQGVRVRRDAMRIDTTFLRRCIASLEASVEGIERHAGGEEIMYDIYRAASVKEFELVLEQSGKLLRKRLAAWFASNRQADRLPFKDLFRHAARHDLMDCDAVERWLRYRDNRTDTAYDYGEDFANATLRLLPEFIRDAKRLADLIDQTGDA